MVISDLKKLSPSILDIKIYELNGKMKSVNGITKATKEKQEIINKIINENTIYTKKYKKITTKIFMTNFADKSINNKIVEITYSISYLKGELIKRITTIFVTILISVVFMIRFLNIFFGTKIKNSIDKMLWLLVLIVFLDLNFIKKEVVIEGVEDIETLELLKEISCEKIQGYYISKPISKENLMIFCKSHAR